MITLAPFWAKFRKFGQLFIPLSDLPVSFLIYDLLICVVPLFFTENLFPSLGFEPRGVLM